MCGGQRRINNQNLSEVEVEELNGVHGEGQKNQPTIV